MHLTTCLVLEEVAIKIFRVNGGRSDKATTNKQQTNKQTILQMQVEFSACEYRVKGGQTDKVPTNKHTYNKNTDES